VAAPNLSELAQKRFEVVRSPDGRITNYYDKQTGRTLSQTEFNNFIRQQAGLPSGLQAFDQNSIGSIMGRANEMLPFAQQLGLGQPGVLPLDQQKPNVLTGTAMMGGQKGSARLGAPEIPVAEVLPPSPRNWGRAPVVHDVMPEPTAQLSAPTAMPQLTSSVPPFPPPAGRAPMPPMPAPPPAGAPDAAVRSWFGKLSGKQKAALGAVGAGVGYAVMNKAADTARKQSAPGAQPEQGAAQGGWDIAGGLVDTAVKNASKPSQQPKAAPMPSRAANVLRAASAAQGQAAPQQEVASAAAGGADKVPVTTSGRPDYNYYAEMMNAADRNDAYARDLINLKEQARMAAIDAGARGEKFRFVPVKDYMNNRIIFVNAGGNDVVLDMNDPRQGVEYQKLLEKSGVDAATMTDWMHRSSRPMLRYMQPAGGNRDVTPDFGYMRRSVEVGEGKPAAQATAPTFTPMAPPAPQADKEQMPTPTAKAPTRPEPQPTSVASFDSEYPKDVMSRPEQANQYGFDRNPRRGMEYDWSQKMPPMQTVADQVAQLGSSVGDVNEAQRRVGNYDYDTETYKPSMTPMEDALATQRLQNKMVSNLGKKRRK